jgi:hypothetical protein
VEAGSARILTWVVVDPERALGVAARVAVAAISVVGGMGVAGNVDVMNAAGDSGAGAPGACVQLVSSKTNSRGSLSGLRTSQL